MKKKYTINIADMEINVITEAPQEDVEYIVGILDRKMREISLKSKKCTRNEAALLCALDLCAEKIALKNQVEELEESLEERNDKFEHLCEKHELVQKNCERLERERARLEVENSRLRAMIDDASNASNSGLTPKEEPEEPVADNVSPEIVEEIVAEDASNNENKAAPKKKGSGKSRVGAMFDLLTFSDI